MAGAVHTEVLLAACYAVFLMAAAGLLELAARHSHHRSKRLQVVGFRYDPLLDLWMCPNNQKLLRAEADYQRNVVIYRAAAHACNTCAIKHRCTDSDGGRTVERAPDSWLDSELRRFHRGMSLMLFVLAGFILLIEFFRFPDGADRMLTGAITLVTAAAGMRLGSSRMRGRIAGRLGSRSASG